jgi:transposase
MRSLPGHSSRRHPPPPQGCHGHPSYRLSSSHAAARFRPSSEVINGVLRRLGRRAKRLSREVAEAERALAALVAEAAPALLEECGVGPVCGAQLLVATSPVDASSGNKRRHRLNRGGDRQLNWALHIVALQRIRHHAETGAYYQRLLAAGKTTREGRRCVKRALARHFYQRLREIPTLP